jgi:hypothetical protein
MKIYSNATQQWRHTTSDLYIIEIIIEKCTIVCMIRISSTGTAVGRRVWRYQRSNQHPFIEDGQTTQWPKEKVQKDKQRSTKHTHKTKDRVTRTPLKIGGELRCSWRVSSSCSTSGTRRVNLVTNPVGYEYKFVVVILTFWIEIFSVWSSLRYSKFPHMIYLILDNDSICKLLL